MQNRALHACAAFSVTVPFPVKPPTPNTPIFLAVPWDARVPVKRCDWGREAGQSPGASQAVVVGPGFSGQGLLRPEALPRRGN